MLWLYVSGLMVLLGLEINAVLARTAEQRKGIELVETTSLVLGDPKTRPCEPVLIVLPKFQDTLDGTSKRRRILGVI
jgi:hypothetical protein